MSPFDETPPSDDAAFDDPLETADEELEEAPENTEPPQGDKLAEGLGDDRSA